MKPICTVRPVLLRLIPALLAAASHAPTAASGEEDPGTFVIRGARVFDGVKAIGVREVLVRDGKIDRVGRQVRAPEGATVIDASGKTLLPGLFDCHTHIWSEEQLRAALVFGVTTELDMFMSHEFAAERREEKSPDAASFLTAGTLVTAPGGHGTQFGFEIPTIESAADADAFVAERLREGSDYIKIVYDDGRSIGIPRPTIDRATLEAVVKAAGKQDRLAVVHIGDQESAREALETGANGLVHLFIDREPDASFATLARRQQAFVIPTLSVLESACGRPGGASLVEDTRLAPYLSGAARGELEAAFPEIPGGPERRFDVPLATVKLLAEKRVPILAGTDAPNPGTTHGASIHRELALLVEAGLTPGDALAAATSLPAKIFGLPDRGRIVAGRRADLVLVDGDPLEEITATRAIARVWKRGRAVDREAYREALEKSRAALVDLNKPGVALVSDFEGQRPDSTFGSGWTASTDSLMGGKSTARLELVEGGAEKSERSLAISGKIDASAPFPWGGAIFFPGSGPFTPVDVSAKKAISFWVRGDGKPARVMVFARKLGRIPAVQTFPTGSEWKQHRLELSSFNDIDGSGLMGILFTGGPDAGEFSFRIDRVRLE